MLKTKSGLYCTLFFKVFKCFLISFEDESSMLNHDVPTTLPQLRANHKMHLTKVLSQSTKSCKAKKQYVRGKIFRNWLAYILIRAVKNFCQSSCSQFGFFFGDHGPRVGGGCWLEDGLREIGTWPGGQQMEGHTSRTSRFYKKKYKSTVKTW